MGTWSSEQHTEPRVAVPYSWQSKNQVAAHSEVSPAWTDTSRGEAGSLHACTAKVEKQEDGEEAGGHDSGEIQVNNIKTRSTLEVCRWSGGQAQLTMFIPYLYMRTECISMTPGGKGWGRASWASS